MLISNFSIAYNSFYFEFDFQESGFFNEDDDEV